jgi:predicted O-methyltransferase YrrM
MAYGNPQAGIITIEGNPQLAALASGNFTAAGLQQVTVINDSFDNVISQTFSPLKSDTLVFIDGNHTFDATLRYYRVLGNVSGFRCILVLDDINWSDQMMRAWRAIADMEHSGYIIDLYKLGIIFKGYGGKQQKFRLRY